jgi:HEAT repeat protein
LVEDTVAMRIRSLWLVLAAVGGLAGCQSATPPPPLDLNRAYTDADSALRRAAGDSDPTTRARALQAMGQVMGEDAGANLRQGLEDPDPRVRLAAALAIGDDKDAAMLGLLQARAKEQTGEQDKVVYCGILYALHQLGDDTRLSLLGGFLRDSDAQVRAQAAEVMGKMADPSSDGPLKAMLKEEFDAQVKFTIAAALAGIGEDEYQRVLEGYARGLVLNLRLAAIPVIADCNAPNAKTILQDLSGSAQPLRVRLTAFAALAKMGAPSSAGYDLCVEACRHPHPLEEAAIRKLAADALGWMKNKDAIAALKPLLGNPDGEVRTAAAASILRLLSEPLASGAAATTTTSSTTPGIPLPGRARPGEPATSRAARLAAAAPVSDGPTYPIDKFVLAYRMNRPGLPDLDGVMKMDIVLRQTSTGWVKARQIAPLTTIHLADVPKLSEHRFRGSAIQSINEQIVAYFNAKGLVGIFVAPDEKDIDPQTAQDTRPADDGRTLRLVVAAAVISQVRTVASGERFGDRVDRVNLPAYQSIAANSPLQAATTQPAGDARGLLWKDQLDDYVFSLNRHPGRRVNAALASTGTNGEVGLDYLVTEDKPWSVYYQMLNSGTKATNTWRERAGFIDTQLTGHDDILTLDYTTSGFDADNQVSGAYEAPFFGSRWLRWRVYGNWDTYTASDVGITNEEFTGKDWWLGGEAIANVYQYKDLFIDALAGAHFRHVDTHNETVDINGSADFLLPHVGARLERVTDAATTLASVIAEFNFNPLSGGDDLDNLGRLNVDSSWTTVRWDAFQSFYLEPLFNRSQWHDPAGGPAATPILANEVAFLVRGQYAGDSRLIPQFEDTVGGLYSVRGYPESVTAGDNTIVATAEYRFHIPRALQMTGEPPKLFGKPFRTGSSKYGLPDWDLIARTFVDVGRTVNNQRLSPLEVDETLLSWGLGLELQILRNFSIRCDWGMALRDMENGEVTAGSSRFHIVGTLRW